MSDLAPLHRRLQRALVLATLLPACTATNDDAKTTKKADAKSEPNTSAKEPVVEPPTTAIAVVDDPPPEPIPTEMNFPPCPSGQWCGPKALVEPLRRTDLNTPIDDVEGCPGAIQGTNELDPSKFAEHPGLPLNGAMLANIDPVATKAKRAAGDAETCCYGWMELCPGGRPLLVEGLPLVAGLRSGSDWSAALPAFELESMPAELGTAIAEAWLRDGLTEHASITSFVRARAELAAIGAPEVLLAACDRAAADEVEHARLCFALAERYGAGSLAPRELPELAPRGGGPIAVALSTFVEGCVGETIAAACARRAASSTSNMVVRAVLERIADDESEHAALAWRTIAWLVEREGPRVLAAIAELADSIRAGSMRSDDPAEPAEPEAALLHAQGRLDRRELARVRAQVWRELIDPLLAQLAARPLARAEDQLRA